MDSKKKLVSSWKLCCIIDRKMVKKSDPVRAAGILFKRGAGAIQLRYKNYPSAALAGIAKRIQALAKKYKRTLIINDRIDVALACGTGGAHLGKGDMGVKTARTILGSRAILGKTVHSVRELESIGLEKIDYVGAGPVFFTPVKRRLKSRGTAFIRKTKARSSCPVLAIGGINEKNVRRVIESGADGVCVTRAASSAKRILKQISNR